jgi:hypothetical protein
MIPAPAEAGKNTSTVVENEVHSRLYSSTVLSSEKKYFLPLYFENGNTRYEGEIGGNEGQYAR